MGRSLYALRLGKNDWQVSADDFDLAVARVVPGAQMVEYTKPAGQWTPFRASVGNRQWRGLVRLIGDDPVSKVLRGF